MAGGTVETFTPDGDSEEGRGIEIAELYANTYTPEGEIRLVDDEQIKAHDQKISEPIEFSEFMLGQHGLNRRYRQRNLGVHAGYLMLRRQHPLSKQRFEDGTEQYRLG